MKHRSVGKENNDTNVMIQSVKKSSKSLFKKKASDCFYVTDTNAECRSNDEKDHEVIVDEVKPPCQSRKKKESNHIGEEAFLPVSLETLRRTLNKRIRATPKLLYWSSHFHALYSFINDSQFISTDCIFFINWLNRTRYLVIIIEDFAITHS